ncbi:MAG: tripartite tricarboxylate transporter TctB family protein [Bacillota bacterium]
MNRADLIAGLLGIFLSLYVFWATANFPDDDVLLLGPSFVPFLLALGLCLSSLGLIFKAWVSKKPNGETGFNWKDPGIVRAGMALFVTILYCLALPICGFILTSIFYLVVLMYLLKQRNYLKMFTVALGVTFAVFGIFRMMLKITLPMGIFG